MIPDKIKEKIKAGAENVFQQPCRDEDLYMFTDKYKTKREGFIAGAEFMYSLMEDDACKFVKWLLDNGWERYDEDDRWICPSESKAAYITSFLYKLYQSEVK